MKAINNLFKHWRGIFWLVLILFIAWSVASDSDTDLDTSTLSTPISKLVQKQFPEPANPKTVIFEWEYDDKEYSIDKVFYKTIYNYYKTNPAKDFFKGDSESGYFKGLIENIKVSDDNTIPEIVDDIELEASKNNLSSDELVELIVSFVQSIPYDDNKYTIIELDGSAEESWPRLPYEVLYDNKAICSGKTILTIALLEEIGYGTAIFDFSQEEHISPAVQCPVEYSYNNSGYCYIESTNVEFKIGEKPTSDFDNGKAKAKTTIGQYEANENIKIVLSNPNINIYRKTSGNSYRGVIETSKTIKRIEYLEKEINRLDIVVNQLENEMNRLKNNVDYYDQQAKAAYRKYEVSTADYLYNEYKRLYSQYELAYNKYESQVDEYKRKIDQYNNLVYEYNALIED